MPSRRARRQPGKWSPEPHIVVSLLDIRPGNLAMYYPEANRLVPRMIDGKSKTPAFKSVAARVIPRWCERS